jgi:hypothetical protein
MMPHKRRGQRHQLTWTTRMKTTATGILEQRPPGDARAATVCANCGKQPIIWHHPDGDGDKGRVDKFVTGGTITDVDAEIARCVPLCHGCHYRAHDGFRGFLCDRVAS